MNDQPPLLDMTPQGDFRDPPPPSRADRIASVVLRAALGVVVLAGLLALASLAIVALSVILPILFGAAAVAGVILWWRLRQARRNGQDVRIMVFRGRGF